MWLCLYLWGLRVLTFYPGLRCIPPPYNVCYAIVLRVPENCSLTGFRGVLRQAHYKWRRATSFNKYQLLFNIYLCRSLHLTFSLPFSWSPDSQKACSCYTFENGTGKGKSWQEANKSCRFNKNHLLVLETLREWEFINKTMKGRTGIKYPEWHIGLFKNLTTGKWTWINGKPLTIDKWQKDKPDDESYALIAKEWPPGNYGTFNSIRGDIQKGWICEEETGLSTLSCI